MDTSATNRDGAMYVDRNEAGRIVGAWEKPQREGQEALQIDNAELQAFLAMPSGRWGVSRFRQRERSHAA